MTITDFARVELTLSEPMSIGSGDVDDETDVLPFRDANGLPVIAGTTIAGVLRRLLRRSRCEMCVAREFGHDPNVEGAKPQDPTRSRLILSFAHVLGVDASTRQSLIVGNEADPILRALRAGDVVRRDHVRIDARGAADDMGKFNRDAIPAGVRFRFQVERKRASDETDKAFRDLVSLFHHPLFRLGGASRRGYGGVSADVRVTSFDRRCAADRNALATLRGDLDAPLPQSAQAVSAPETWSDVLTTGLTLRPDAFWLIGSDQDPMGEARMVNAAGEALRPQLTPYRERRYDASGAAREEIVVPASALKGPLRHRALFHYRRRRWIDGHDPRPDAARRAADEALATLFGQAKPGREQGRQAAFLFDRIEVSAARDKIIHHNVLDRFTQGVREGGLYAEQALYRGAISMRLTIDLRGDADPLARRAFLDALDDLAQGRLSIGAGAADGHGFCDGAWKDGGRDKLEEWAGGCCER